MANNGMYNLSKILFISDLILIWRMPIFVNRMEFDQLKDRKVTEIVSSNYVYASILYYFGIRFFEYSDLTLGELCRKKGIDIENVIHEFSKPKKSMVEKAKLSRFPIDLLIEYLKHSHYIFAKKKLPYLANLIESLDGNSGLGAPMERDLKLVFPMFVEDFIHHIYLEEDTFFIYVMNLYKAVSGKMPLSNLFYDMKKYSISHFAADHDVHDDEMEGIRNITNNYEVREDTPLHLKILYSELRDFEMELVSHAEVENHILFPKALGLENEARRIFGSLSRLN